MGTKHQIFGYSGQKTSLGELIVQEDEGERDLTSLLVCLAIKRMLLKVHSLSPI